MQLLARLWGTLYWARLVPDMVVELCFGGEVVEAELAYVETYLNGLVDYLPVSR